MDHQNNMRSKQNQKYNNHFLYFWYLFWKAKSIIKQMEAMLLEIKDTKMVVVATKPYSTMLRFHQFGCGCCQTLSYHVPQKGIKQIQKWLFYFCYFCGLFDFVLIVVLLMWFHSAKFWRNRVMHVWYIQFALRPTHSSIRVSSRGLRDTCNSGRALYFDK